MSREEFYRRAERREECLTAWVDGTAWRVTPAHGRHGRFIGCLYAPVLSWLKDTHGGNVWQEVFVDFSDRTYGVDLAILFQSHLGQYRRGRVHGAPDVILEVLSPESVSRDRSEKFDYYWQHKVPWYWIGDPVTGLLEEYRYTPEGYLRTVSGTPDQPFRPRALEGFVINVTDLLEEPDLPGEQP